MTLKVVVVLLALVLLAGMVGRRLAPPQRRRKRSIEATRKCAACGAYVLAGAACDRPDCPQA